MLTGAIRHITGLDNDGSDQEIWIEGSTQVVRTAGQRRPIIYTAQDTIHPYYTRYCRIDFPGLQWISRQNYAGLAEAGNPKQTCLVFKGTAPADLPPDLPSVPTEAIAYIDLATRLPVYLKKDGKESIYTFGKAPGQLLPFPQELTDLINARQKHVEEMTRMPARPY